MGGKGDGNTKQIRRGIDIHTSTKASIRCTARPPQTNGVTSPASPLLPPPRAQPPRRPGSTEPRTRDKTNSPRVAQDFTQLKRKKPRNSLPQSPQKDLGNVVLRRMALTARRPMKTTTPRRTLPLSRSHDAFTPP